jgi:hypothetical protein
MVGFRRNKHEIVLLRMFVVRMLVMQMRTLVSMHIINNVKIMSATDLHSSFRGIISPVTNGKMAVFFHKLQSLFQFISVELRNVNHERKQMKFALNHVKIFLCLKVFREFL